MKASACVFFCMILGFFYGQEVYEDYTDGKIYVKLDLSSAKALFGSDPSNIDTGKLEFASELFAEFGVTNICRPFYQAEDDAVLPLILRISFTAATKVDEFIEKLSRRSEVVYAEKVPLLRTLITPNDYAISSASVHLAQINAPQAWDLFNGTSSVVVAIVDNSVMWSHVDLVANTYTNAGEIPNNNTDDDGNGFIDDVNGFDVADGDNNTQINDLAFFHGTHCAGVAGARTDNNIGVASIGWNIKILPVKATSNLGSPSFVPFGYEGIIYAVKAKARVISCSFGGTGSAQSEQAVVNYAWNRGSLIIASSGNINSVTPHYPCAYTHVYCVTAVDQSDIKWAGSNYGNWVDISAPGVNILSTMPYTSTPAYQPLSGTSMAAPMVAGLAGLMLSKSPQMTATDVMNCISSSAVNIYSIGANSTYSTGNQLGAGRINAFAAMTCAASFSTMPPVANFYAFPPNTCPGSTVAFTDSSLYIPTTWNWTFQGGSPATSTLVNPVVQWATPGNYSVSLTVTNAHGNNTKTKLSYINVSNPGALPFSEGFQNTQFLPSGWTAKNYYNDEIFWERKTGVGGFGTSTACAMFDNYLYHAPGERDEMWTPKFNLSNSVSARLRFDVAYARYNAFFSDSLEVKLSTNCGATWSSIYIKGGSTLATVSDQSNLFVPTANQWRRDTIDITGLAAGQSNVMFSFIDRGQFGQPIYLDNINLAFPVPTLNVTHPASVCVGSSVSFSNSSAGSYSYTWNFQGGSPPNSSTTSPVVTYNSPGTYTLSLAGVNGSSQASVTRTIHVFSVPVLTLTASHNSLCSGTSLTLTASGANSYSWNTGSTQTTLVESPTVTSMYTVTGINGSICTAVETITVSVTTSPTLSVNDQTICPGGTATLTASGAPNYSWSTGDLTNSVVISPTSNSVLTVSGYNGSCIDTKTVNLAIGASLSLFFTVTPATVCAGEPATITVNGASSYTWDGGATVATIVVTPIASSVYSVLGTAGTCTGSGSASITVVPLPNIFLNANPGWVVCAGTSVTLTAIGASNFTWSSGSFGSQAIVTPTGVTTYTIAGSVQGCTAMETLTVTGVTNTIALNIAASQFSVCPGGSATLTASGAASYTWSTGSNAQSITVSPLSTTGYTISGSDGLCNASTSAQVTVLTNPHAQITTTNTYCDEPCTGIATGNISGGSAPYNLTVSGSTCTVFPCTGLCQGNYTVSISDVNNCSISAQFSVDCNSTVSLDELNKSFRIGIYPNPAREEFIIHCNETGFTFRIFNCLGQIVEQGISEQAVKTVDCRNLVSGVYFVEVSANEQKIEKVIIDKY